MKPPPLRFIVLGLTLYVALLGVAAALFTDRAAASVVALVVIAAMVGNGGLLIGWYFWREVLRENGVRW